MATCFHGSNSRAVDLLEHDWLVTQLSSLTTNGRGGRNSIDHAPGTMMTLRMRRRVRW